MVQLDGVGVFSDLATLLGDIHGIFLCHVFHVAA